MEQHVVVLAAAPIVADTRSIEIALAGPRMEFEHCAPPACSRVPLASLRVCDALIWHGDRELADWTPGLLARCRIVVRVGASVDEKLLQAFGAQGVPFCKVAPPAERPQPRDRRRALTDRFAYADAVRTVVLYLHEGFMRDCINTRWLRLGALRVAHPHEPLTSTA